MLARLHWNPELDVDAVIDDYCRSGFGPGWEHVRHYFTRLEEITDRIAEGNVLEVTPNEYIISRYYPGIPFRFGISEPYTPEVITELRGRLDAAAKASDDAKVHARIALLRAGLDFTELQGRIHRLMRRLRNGDLTGPERQEMLQLLDRKWLLMRRIVREQPLAVNLAVVCRREWGWFKPVGWTGPSEAVRKAAAE